jgi:hypothetical protein
MGFRVARYIVDDYDEDRVRGLLLDEMMVLIVQGHALRGIFPKHRSNLSTEQGPGSSVEFCRNMAGVCAGVVGCRYKSIQNLLGFSDHLIGPKEQKYASRTSIDFLSLYHFLNSNPKEAKWSKHAIINPINTN